MQARLRGDNALAKALEKKLLELPRATPGGPNTTPRPGPAGTIAATPDEAIATAGATGATGAAAARLSAWERDDGAESVASANAGSVANYSQVLLRLISGREVVVDLSTVRLDDFQKVFTSEDNASFEAVLEKDRERRRQKEWWVEGSEEKHNTKCQALKDQISESHSTGEIMTCEFQARNTFYFKPRGEIPELIEKPTVESRNTRFTTQEQSDLDETLIAAIAARHARESGQQFSEVLAKMVKDGTFSVAALHSHGNVRAVGGRLQTPMGQAGSYPMVNTPALLPGENGFSPLMTFGKIEPWPTWPISYRYPGTLQLFIWMGTTWGQKRLIYCTISHYIALSYFIILYHTLSYFIILYHTLSYFIILYHTLSYFIILYHTLPYFIILYHTLSYFIILYHTLSVQMLIYCNLLGRRLPGLPDLSFVGKHSIRRGGNW